MTTLAMCETKEDSVSNNVFSCVHFGPISPRLYQSQLASNQLPVTQSARPVTGINVNGQGKMFVKGKDVECVPVYTEPAEISRWLEPFQNVLLFAHNGTRFDFPLFILFIVDLQCLYTCIVKNVWLGLWFQ